MIPDNYRRFVLASRPETLPQAENFAIESPRVQQPAQGELLVKVLLVALSPWQGQRLKDFRNYTQPFDIGELIDCDVLGQVVASNAAGIEIGKLVTGRLGWQEYATTKPEGLTEVSEEFEDTVWLSALSSPGLTAYSALDLFARPMPGQTMVVTSAAGSVGSYAVQLGKLAGMRVVGVAGSDDKCERVMAQLCADTCVNHSHETYSEKLAEACNDGVNLVFDTVGGPVADRVYDNLSKHAKVLLVGRTASNNSDRPDLDFINARQLWAREASIQCFSRYSYPRAWAQARERMMELYRQQKLTTLDNVIEGFDQTPAALRDMLSGQYTGKVMVRYAERLPVAQLPLS